MPVRARMFLPVLALAAVTLCAALPARASGLDAFAQLSGELRIAGSDVGLTAVMEAAKRIMAVNPAIRISYEMTGLGAGARRLKLRQADICLFDRDPGAMSGGLQPFAYVAYGVDPVAVVVNPKNTVSGLAAEQIRAMFSAKMRFWPDGGGTHAPVMPVYYEASTEEGRPETRPGNLSASSQPALRIMLIREKDILAYVSMRELDAAMKPLAVDGRPADMASFRDGRYTVYRLMHAAMDQSRPPLAKAFLDYMAGPEGQKLLLESGYLPLADKPAAKSVLPVENPELMASGR
jgi:phosphate transport system substrate-binding protein